MNGAVNFRCEVLPSIPALEHEWQALHARARPSFFTSWHWIGTLLAALPETERPQLLRGCAGSVTVALALLGAGVVVRRRGLIRSRSLYLNETGDPRYDTVTIEHNGLVTAIEHEAASYDGLATWFAGRRNRDELLLRGTLSGFRDGISDSHRLARQQTTMPSYSVDLTRLAASAGDISAVLSANARQQLRRAARWFENIGPLQLDRAASAEQAQAFLTALKPLHIQAWTRRGKSHAFSDPFFERFHRLLIDRSFAAGAIEALRIRAGAETVGCLYNFRHGDRVYAYQSGFAEFDNRARPGAVSHALAIRAAHDSGALVYDFMAGHNRLKESFATDCEPMLSQSLQQPRLRFRLERLGLLIQRLPRPG